MRQDRNIRTPKQRPAGGGYNQLPTFAVVGTDTRRFSSDRPNRSNRPSRGSITITPEVVIPQTRKKWKQLHKGTLRRLSHLSSMSVKSILALSDADLYALADQLKFSKSGVRPLVNKIVRLRAMPFYSSADSE